MGPTPILEMARAYGLRPRLWLLTELDIVNWSLCNLCAFALGLAGIFSLRSADEPQEERTCSLLFVF